MRPRLGHRINHRAARGRGEEPAGIPVRAPVRAEERERVGRKRDDAIHPALAVVHVQQGPRAIHIRHVELEPFEETETARVNRRETDPIRRPAHGSEHAADFVAAQDHRELLIALRPREVENGPAAPEALLVEEAQPREGLRDTRGRERRGEVEEVRAELLLREVIRCGVVKPGEPRDDTDVRRDRAGSVAAEREVLDQALAERGHTILSERRGEDETTNRLPNQHRAAHRS